MFCPQCGERRPSEGTNYCAGCGYLLTGTAELLAAGGLVPTRGSRAASPKSRGVKQGLFIFMLGFLVVPLIAMFSIWLHAGPFFALASAVSLFLGGLLRTIYAIFFESSVAGMPTLEEKLMNPRSLPPTLARQDVRSHYGEPIGHAGMWRDTNDLPPSIVEGATRPLSSGELR